MGFTIELYLVLAVERGEEKEYKGAISNAYHWLLYNIKIP